MGREGQATDEITDWMAKNHVLESLIDQELTEFVNNGWQINKST